VSVAGIFTLTFLLAAVASQLGHAQVASPSPQPLVPGFVSPYEIMHTLRSAGFDPLAPPLREGTTYVARATDYRGILMRVVLDARTGAIRDANRIMLGPGAYGPDEVGMLPPSDDMPPPYRAPPAFDPAESSLGAQLPSSHQATHAVITIFPPLPRPRPSEFASRTSNDASSAKPDARPAVASDPKPDAKADVTNIVTPAPVVSVKPGKAPVGAPIND
jgi:hypothetical protein